MSVYIGIDWGKTSQVICFLNEAGAVIAQQVIPHTPEGFAKFDAQRQKLGLKAAACVVGIETAYSLLVDYLWGQSPGLCHPTQRDPERPPALSPERGPQRCQ